jgi:DNA repair exonuclease SbcCD ATPase subunit
MVNITNLANQYLAMDESSSIRINLSIEQKGQNFNINAKQDGFEIQEVSTLSGAEKSTVNRALATAIAFSKVKSKYGNYSFDEADSALSQSNKLAFAKNIKDIADHDMVEQLFIISHDNGITDYLDANKLVMGENT